MLRTPLSQQITFFIYAVLLLGGCQPMSEMKQNPTAGFNGGFEITESNLPVNWILYTEKTVGSGEFNISTDNKIVKSGSQSLNFDVRSCSDKGGRFSPGCAAELNVSPGRKYTLSFWLKNEGTTFTVSAGAIQPTSGLVKTVLKSSYEISEWKQFEYVIEVPADYNKIRFELSVLSAGKLWIDEVRIE